MILTFSSVTEENGWVMLSRQTVTLKEGFG